MVEYGRRCINHGVHKEGTVVTESMAAIKSLRPLCKPSAPSVVKSVKPPNEPKHKLKMIAKYNVLHQ